VRSVELEHGVYSAPMAAPAIETRGGPDGAGESTTIPAARPDPPDGRRDLEVP
jgi:hypothetical protein